MTKAISFFIQQFVDENYLLKKTHKAKNVLIQAELNIMKYVFRVIKIPWIMNTKTNTRNGLIERKTRELKGFRKEVEEKE